MIPKLKCSAALLLAGVVQSGCSIITPVPLWEMAKAGGVVAGMAMPYASSQASNTVYHLHPTFQNVCIEFNPDAAVADVVPALQIELRKHQIESRVYEHGTLLEECSVWIRYVTQIAWDVPPMGNAYRAYVNAAALTLQSANGRVLSSSHYELGQTFGMGKWASTQSKLAPVVTALLTGFQS